MELRGASSPRVSDMNSDKSASNVVKAVVEASPSELEELDNRGAQPLHKRSLFVSFILLYIILFCMITYKINVSITQFQINAFKEMGFQ